MTRTIERCVSLGRRASPPVRGASYLEYIIIVGVVALCAVQALTMFGTDVGAKIRSQGTRQSLMGL